MMKAVCVLLSLIAVCSADKTWSIKTENLATVLIGVQFTDANTGFLAADVDGEGPAILKTTDGATSWNEAPHSGSAMMFLDITMGSGQNGVVSGIGLLGIVPGMEYTLNGNTWNASVDLELDSECQSTEDIAGMVGGFGLAGQYGDANGVAISIDHGATYDHVACNLNDSYPTRYGSFPSPSTWYLTAGMWPDSTGRTVRTPTTTTRKLSQKVSLEYNHVTGRTRHILNKNRSFDKNPSNDGYTAAITKTTDSGKTWTTVYVDNGNFYFNAISCPNVNTCWAVGESEDDSPNPGSRILYTGDGGKTWTVQLYNKGGAYSLMAIRFVTGLEGWAAGGLMDATFTGQFFHTVDGGKTWTLQKVAGEYINNLGFWAPPTTPYVGWATSFNWMDQSSLLQYS
jgi:photosystem II stability/assembly factor-like uncharacterized protein